MSLDDLITLLLVALFVGAPLLRRILGRGGRRPGQGASTQGEGESDGSERASEERSSSAAERSGEARADRGSTTASRDTDRPQSDFERRLAEARRRVQEAREGASGPRKDAQDASGRRGQASDRGVREPSFEPLVRPRTEASPGFLGREGIREPRPKTAPLKVSKRKRKRRGSTLSSAEDVVSVRPHDIVQGIVWHQILSEPVSKRRPRRSPSRVR